MMHFPRCRVDLIAVGFLFLTLSCGQTRIEDDTSLEGPVEIASDETEDEAIPGACPTGFAECSGYCLDVASNARHCGGCGTACSTDEACISSLCVDLCDEVSVSTTGDLASLLTDLSWVSTRGVMGYAVTSADVSIHSSDLGDGYILVPEMDGLVLGSEIVYGFESLPVDIMCWYGYPPMHPSTGYGAMTVPAGTSFIAYFASFGAAELDPMCSDEYYCVYEFGHPVSSCCCCSEPFLWNIITIADAPQVCTIGTDACLTDLAGTDHSLCYTTYTEYMSRAIDVHQECVEHEHGHVLPGRECTCEVGSGDLYDIVEGMCTEAGMCDVDLSSPHSYVDRGCV